MTKYRATYGFNVRRYINREIEAESHEEAERIARAEAWSDIDAECARFENLDDFASTEPLDAYLMLDALDAEGKIDEELVAETLPDPAQPATSPAPAQEPSGYVEPERLPDRRFRVRFFMNTTTCDRHSVQVRASSAEEAPARVEAWQRGEIELTQAEELTENLDKEMGVEDSDYSGPAIDEWDAPVEIDADGYDVGPSFEAATA